MKWFLDNFYTLSCEHQELIFTNNSGSWYKFDLDKQKVSTNTYYTSEKKYVNRAIKKVQEELKWDNIQEINFW